MILRLTAISLVILSAILPCGGTDRLCHAITSANPAAMPFRQDSSLTTISLDGNYANTALTRAAQMGDGYLTGGLSASSYHHLGSGTTVWGDARFLTGTTRDVMWNNSADYDLVGPYVIGDPVGGDLKHQSYDFGGGYAGKRHRWSWGVEASYRAAIDHRSRDPRDKIVVSDLKGSVGGSFRPGSSPLAIGVSGKFRIYNQTAQLEFYSPTNDIPTYAMTGLGSFYPRFSGNSSRNTAYSGAGFGGAVTLFPVKETARSIIGGVHFNNLTLRQYLRDFNNLELTRTSTSDIGADFGMMFGSSLRYGIYITGRYNRKAGKENLLGPSSGNSYPKIGERENYLAELLQIHVRFHVEIDLGEKDHLTTTVSGLFDENSELLRSPYRKVATRSITPAVNAQWTHGFRNRVTLTISSGISRRFTSLREISLDGVDPDSDIGRMVIRNTALTTSDVTDYGLQTRISFPVKNYDIFIHADWKHLDFASRCGSADYLLLSVGIEL